MEMTGYWRLRTPNYQPNDGLAGGGAFVVSGAGDPEDLGHGIGVSNVYIGLVPALCLE